MLENFDLAQLETFQLEIPSLKENLLRSQQERERSQEKDAQRIAKGHIPISLVADSWVEERWQTEKLATGEEKKYLYYLLRWKEGKKLKCKTLKRGELADPEIRALVEYKLGKPIDPYYDL